jgi:hypothetical protein
MSEDINEKNFSTSSEWPRCTCQEGLPCKLHPSVKKTSLNEPAPRNVGCRACGSDQPHTDTYEEPTEACISFLRSRNVIAQRRLEDMEAFIEKIKRTFEEIFKDGY